MSRSVAEIREEMARARKVADDAGKALTDTLLALRAELEASARAQFGTATCPRRMGEMGPWAYEEGLDWWEPEPNGERACSFCGSMHPDDFDRFLDRVLGEPENEKVRISVADRRHKLYIERPEVRNAIEGPIKFYVAHAPEDWRPADSPAHAKLAEATRVSREKFERHMAALPWRREAP